MAAELDVAVAILQRADGRVLVAQRAAWRHAGGKLEFPGGKIDAGETLAAALARELREELGVEPLRWSPLLCVRHCYPGRPVALHVCRVDTWTGEPAGLEDQDLHWVRPADLSHEAFPAANRPIVAALQFPDRCLITPTADEASVGTVVEGLARAMAAGVRLVQLRAPGLSNAGWQRLLAEACRVAANAPGEVRLLANTDDVAIVSRHSGLAGLHLSARAARALRRRPLPADKLLSCSCHDAEEIRQAERLGADFILIGSVGVTSSHPGREPLGWAGLAGLTALTALPVYALGGLGEGDIATARRHGAIGIAAIRGLWPVT